MTAETEHHERVIDYFEKSKLGYDMLLWGAKHFGFYPDAKKGISEKRAQELMQDSIAKNLRIKKNQLILDAGCGQGIVSAYLARKYGCNITGITLVPFEVRKAKELVRRLGADMKVNYYLMDYSKTKFKDNQFDAIYTMESFVHSPNAKKTLNEFFRILRPGGRLAMFEYTIAEDGEFKDWEKRMLDIVIEKAAMASLRDMRHDSFPKTLKEAGFTHVKEQNISQYCHPSLERLHKLAKLPYVFVKLFSLQKRFVNVTAAVECYEMAKKGLIHYCIFTARK